MSVEEIVCDFTFGFIILKKKNFYVQENIPCVGYTTRSVYEIVECGSRRLVKDICCIVLYHMHVRDHNVCRIDDWVFVGSYTTTGTEAISSPISIESSDRPTRSAGSLLGLGHSRVDSFRPRLTDARFAVFGRQTVRRYAIVFGLAHVVFFRSMYTVEAVR